jgi:hypothetical protein
MAYDQEEATYYLTMSGWTRTSEAPPDWLEKWHYSMRQSSNWTREQATWACEEVNEAYASDQRADAHTRFPIPGSDLPRRVRRTQINWNDKQP